MEARGAVESAHRVRQMCGQIFRFAVASGMVERDISVDLKGALVTPKKTHYAAITDPKRVGTLMRAIYGYQGHPCRGSAEALRAAIRPSRRLRAAEWEEIDFAVAEWRIPAHKMKMKTEHIVPLSTQALHILQALEPMTGHARYAFPSIRTDEPLHEREHRQCGIAQHGLHEGRYDRPRVSGDGADHPRRSAGGAS